MISRLLIITILAFITGMIVKYTTKKLSPILIHLIFLLITPWFLTVILGRPTILELLETKPPRFIISTNIAFMTSTDLMFFRGEPRLTYAVGEHGYFLPSFLPLIILGLWISIKSKRGSTKRLLILLISGLLLSFVLSRWFGLLSVVLFLPTLSVLATLGFLELISIFKDRSTLRFVKAIIFVNISLILYESIRLFHTIQVQHKLLN